MSTSRYYGLDLPEYDPCQVTFARGRNLAQECNRLTAQGLTSVIRAVIYRTVPEIDDLKQILLINDRELDRLDEHGRTLETFSMVSGHSWGLTKVQANPTAPRHPQLNPVPIGYALVANVPLVNLSDRPLTYDQRTNIFDALDGYWEGRRQAKGWMHDDMHVDQFVNDASGKPICVDVEPHLFRRHP
jgi:hypothetical protein